MAGKAACIPRNTPVKLTAMVLFSKENSSRGPYWRSRIVDWPVQSVESPFGAYDRFGPLPRLVIALTYTDGGFAKPGGKTLALCMQNISDYDLGSLGHQ
ncbi:hypothetical protein [Bradyrhizobium sp. USDA 4473]